MKLEKFFKRPRSFSSMILWYSTIASTLDLSWRKRNIPTPGGYFCTLQSTTWVNRLVSCSNQAERGAGPRRGDGWVFCPIRPLLEGKGPLEPLDDEINGDLGEFQSENWTIAHPTACMCGWGRYHLFFLGLRFLIIIILSTLRFTLRRLIFPC